MLDRARDVHMAETEWVGLDAACNVLLNGDSHALG